MITVTLPKNEYDRLVLMANANEKRLTLTKDELAKYFEKRIVELAGKVRALKYATPEDLADFLVQRVNASSREEAERFDPITEP